MKKLLCLLSALVLLVSLWGVLPVAAASGNLAVSADVTTVTVGSSVKVTLKYTSTGSTIGAITARVKYNTDLYEFVSCSEGEINGGAGVQMIVWYAPNAEAPASVSFVLTFKAKAAGSGAFEVTTTEFVDDNTGLDYSYPTGSVTVAANNPTLSGNANLSSLKPSKGTLTPKFDPNVTNYTVSVSYTVTSLTLSATTDHKDAKTSVSGKNALEVGKNTRTVTVTAPNGTTKKYTVVITRAAQQTTTSSSGGTTTTTTPPPAEDALEVEVGGVLMTIADTQPKVDAPAGFKYDYTTVNGVEVSAAKNATTGMLLLYLTNSADKTSAFYIYDAAADRFTPYRPLTVAGGIYVLHDLPDSETAPIGTAVGTIDYEGGTVSAYVYEDTELADFAIVYVTAPDGDRGLYAYDRTDGSLQRYHAVTPPPQDIIAPPQPNPEYPNALVAFVVTYQRAILIVAAACAALAILAVAIVLVVRYLPVRSRGKH